MLLKPAQSNCFPFPIKVCLVRTLGFLSVLTLLTACSDRKEESSESYAVTGFVEASLDGQNRLLVDHEEIPDFMPPMIMLFEVADPAEATSLEPGEQIRFRFHLNENRSWIDSIEPTGNTRPVRDHKILDDSPNPDLLTAGDALPDYAFLDEDGDTVHLSDYRGSVVAITFIFTRCPVPEYCPTMMRNFGNVDQILNEELQLTSPWKLVTISFDPENDTPEVMKRYGQAFDYDPESWDLLTSKSLDPIKGIAANVGLKYGKQGGSYLHNLRTVVLDTDGKIHRIFTSEDWSPEELATAMQAAQ